MASQMDNLSRALIPVLEHDVLGANPVVGAHILPVTPAQPPPVTPSPPQPSQGGMVHLELSEHQFWMFVTNHIRQQSSM
jgi:hypothetical protein